MEIDPRELADDIWRLSQKTNPLLHVSIISTFDDESFFHRILHLVFNGSSAMTYSIDGASLTFQSCWYDDNIRLPYDMDSRAAADFALHWMRLNVHPPDSFGLTAKSCVVKYMKNGEWVQQSKGTSPVLILRWSDACDSNPLPVAFDVEAATGLVSLWLHRDKYPDEQPDHDGDNGYGFRAFNEAWGHVNGDPYAIIAIMPAWAICGK